MGSSFLTRTDPGLPALGTKRYSHWTAREVPSFASLQKCSLGWVLYKSQVFMARFVTVPTSWVCFEYQMRSVEKIFSTVSDT